MLRDDVTLANGSYVIKTEKMQEVEEKYNKSMYDLLQKWYVDQGLGTEDIVAMVVVSKWLKAFKIPARPKVGDPTFYKK